MSTTREALITSLWPVNASTKAWASHFKDWGCDVMVLPSGNPAMKIVKPPELDLFALQDASHSLSLDKDDTCWVELPHYQRIGYHRCRAHSLVILKDGDAG